MDKKISVSTRFHSWAENDFSQALDLNQLIVQHPAATFFMRVKGEGMLDAGVASGDILVIDRALSLANNKIIIARLDGQLIVRRVQLAQGALILTGDERFCQPIIITADRDFEVWGVVTYIIRQT
ncbi:MAG: SOS-response transcriptional regulator UmuD-like protein [Candidatus Babeliales bacterium]